MIGENCESEPQSRGATSQCPEKFEAEVQTVEIKRVENGFIVTTRDDRLRNKTFIAGSVTIALGIIDEEVKN